MPAEGGIRFGQYVLQRCIARGGMAEVFLAQQRGLEGFDRRVAVKRILPHLASASDFIQMFLGEAKLAAQLSHPNIVHIYDFGKVDTDYFIAMEYVDGVHAGQVVRRADTDRLPPAMVARIGADAAAALHHAHELRAPGGQPYGLVHRDVSPANLMVSFDGSVKLCDFGIAKAVALGDRQLTSPGLVKGKYAYMSPEQTGGMALDGRSDVYALAIVLWELVAGRVLVPRGDAVAAMRAIRNGRLTPLREAAPWTPAPLAEAIAWALETRREQRATAAQLAHALEAFIKSSPEIATPMQLGGWLRARFARDSSEPGAPPGATQMSPSTLDGSFAAAGEPSGFELGSPGAAGSFSADTTSETVALDSAGASASTVMAAPLADAARLAEQRATGFESTDPAAEPTAGDPPEDAAPTGPRPPRPGSPSSYGPAPPRPAELRPSAVALEHGETLLRSGAYRPLVPSGPAAVPTLLESRPVAAMAPVHDSRPAAAMPTLLESRPAAALPPLLESRPVVHHRMSPMFGLPALPAQGPPRVAAMSPAARAVALTLGMCGLAVLSFAIVLSVRGSRGNSVGHAAVLAARDAALPIDAAPLDAPAPGDAAADVPGADAPAVPTHAAIDAAIDAAITAQLDVHTEPAGASVAIYRCPDPDPASCGRGRAGDAAKLDGCRDAQCTFHLPVGSYEIVVELDGATESRAVALTGDLTTSLDIVFKAAQRGGRQAGKLTVHTRQRCDVLVDARRHLQTPIVELELRPGAHKLELTCGRRSITRNVTVMPGKTTDLSVAPR